MIQTNAKCVVNGKKVNEIAGWVNQFIKLTNEEIDIVDTGNTPGKRWFLTGKLAGGLGAGSAEDGDRNNLGGTGGSALGAGGGGGNLDKLNMAAAAPLNQGGAAMPPNIVAAAMPPMKPPAGGAGGGSANMISIGGRQVRQQPTTEATEATTPAPPVALRPPPVPPSAPTPPPTSATSTDTSAEQAQVSSPVNTNTDTARVANEIQSEKRRLEQEIQRLVARRDGIKSQLKLNANVWSYETNLKYMNEMRELDKKIKELQA
jgi:hypothetical protein